MVTGWTASRARIADRKVWTSVHDRLIFRRATWAISFSSCTLIDPPASMSCSTRSAFAGSFDARYSRTFVSKKLPDICLVAVELEIRGEPSAERAKALQQLRAARLPRHGECARIGNVDFNLVAFLQRKRFDNGGGKTDSKAVAPLRDLHVDTPQGCTLGGIYVGGRVYPTYGRIKQMGRPQKPGPDGAICSNCGARLSFPGGLESGDLYYT